MGKFIPPLTWTYWPPYRAEEDPVLALSKSWLRLWCWWLPLVGVALPRDKE
jgi:hypothetical protein